MVARSRRPRRRRRRLQDRPRTQGSRRGPGPSGALRGATWNSHAFFSPDIARFEAKQRVLFEVAADRDFVMVQEARSSEGALTTWTQPTGREHFHVHGSRQSGGVGVLASEGFLKQLERPASRSLEETVPGRIEALWLNDPAGRLDTVVVYADARDPEDARAGIRLRLSKALPPLHAALTVLAGGRNYVSPSEDRFAAAPLAWTGTRDAKE